MYTYYIYIYIRVRGVGPPGTGLLISWARWDRAGKFARRSPPSSRLGRDRPARPDTLHTLQGATHPRRVPPTRYIAYTTGRDPPEDEEEEEPCSPQALKNAVPPPSPAAHDPPATLNKKTFRLRRATDPPLNDPPATCPRPTRKPPATHSRAILQKKHSHAARNDPQAIHSPPARDPPATFFNLFSFAYGAQPTRFLATRRRPVRDPPANRPQPTREPFCKKFLSPAARNDPPAIHSPLTHDPRAILTKKRFACGTQPTRPQLAGDPPTTSPRPTRNPPATHSQAIFQKLSLACGVQ